MKLKLFSALVLFLGLAAAYPQASPFSNSLFPSQTFTGSSQTGAVIQLNGLVIPSTIGSSFASGTITLTANSLTTVTFAVQGSSDNGTTYFPLAISSAATPGTTSTSVTATASGLYQVNLAGLTHVRFVTSGTFTATSITLQLNASPNAMISRSAGGGGGGGSSPTFTASGIGTLYGFGDSTMAGAFAITPADSAFAVLARDYPGPAVDSAISGAFMSGSTAQLFNVFPPVLTANQLPVIIQQGGINDANSLGATTGALNNYKLELDASMYWAELPPSNKIMASSATAVGFAATYNGAGVNSNNAGTAKQSITAGDTLTFNGTTAANKVGITYAPQVTSVGTFTVSLNGVLQTDVCSGTTTFSNFGCNAQAITQSTFFRQEFFVTPGAYTVVVTVTGTTGATNVVSILDVDSIPMSSTGLPVFIMNGVLRQNTDLNSATTAAFNAADLSVVSQAIADSLNVHFVDVRNGTPGVNITTDMAANSTMCPSQGSNVPLHPNKCGYLDWASTVENAVTGVFVAGINKTNTFFGPLTSFTPVGNGSPLFASWNSNAGGIIPSASIWAPGYCSFSNPIYCVGMNFSATQNTFTNAMYTTGTTAIQHCSGALPSSCTDSAFWDITGNQHALLGYIGPAVAPTVGNACTPNGVWEFTQDGHASVCLGLVWVQKF